MKNFYALIIALFPMVALAQPTITSDWFPQTGHSVMLESIDSSSVDPGPAGADVSWDFSGLVAIDTIQPITSEYVDPATTPYASSFPDADIAVETTVMGLSAYSYSRIEGNRFEVLGAGLSQGLIVYSDPEVVMETPFTYQSSFEDDYVADVMISFFNFTEYGQVEVRGDAYGTLILPGQTFENVLRIRSHDMSRDTFSFLETNINIYLDTTYQWVIPNYPSPIFTYTSAKSITLTLNQQTGEFDTTSVTYAEDASRDLNASPTAIGEAEYKLVDCSVFPNPAVESVSVRWSDDVSVDRVSVRDLQGNILQSQKVSPTQPRAEIDLRASIGNGMYFLTLETADGDLLGKTRFVRLQ